MTLVVTLGAASWVSGFAVALAMATGRDNIYSIPEYSGGQDGKTFFHAFAHFFIAPFLAGLIAWGLSSLVMLATKVTTEPPAQRPRRKPRRRSTPCRHGGVTRT